MASLKEIKGRIASVQSTQKITSAMRMVASAKLHRTQGMTADFLNYEAALRDIVESILGAPLPSPKKSIDFNAPAIIPISSSSGLCGGYNSNITHATIDRVGRAFDMGANPVVLPIGKKIAHELDRAGIEHDTRFVTLADEIGKHGDFAKAIAMVDYLMELLDTGRIDGAEFIHHHFKSMSMQLLRFSPMLLRTPDMQAKSQEKWLTEPEPDKLLKTLYRRLLNAQAYGNILDSLTSEHAARMLAMQTADDNANDLLRELTLIFNKTRQQSITNELIDIMGGRQGESA